MSTMRHPSQADWPDEHDAVVRRAVQDRGTWPAELESGVMFYMGERVTREEFMAAKAARSRQRICPACNLPPISDCAFANCKREFAAKATPQGAADYGR